MNFVYPNFLWAYLLIAIPIIIHLFNFRRYKNVYFSRVKFLREVTEDSKSGLMLKHLLVLISRILAVFCLVTAFAQPFIPTGENINTENITSIYIDNSYSMEALGQDGNLLNEVKNQAIELVRSFEENEKINLLTSDLLSLHQRFYSKDEVIEMIKNIDLSAKSTELKSVINTQIDLLSSQEGENNKRIFIMSDFQKSTSDLEGLKQGEVTSFIYQANAEQNANIFIDSAWFISPVHKMNSPMEIHFRLRNISDKEDSISVSLSIDGNEPGPKKVGIPPNSFTDSKITFTDRTPGIKQGILHISTSQLFFDDDLYFTYEIKEKVNILIVKNRDDRSINLEQLYALDDYYNADMKFIGDVSQEDFKDRELIVFQNIKKLPSGISDMINEGLKDGLSVLMIPGEGLDKNSWNTFFNQHNLPRFENLDTSRVELSYFNFEDPLYIGVFEQEPKNYEYSNVYARYKLSVENRNNFVVLFGSNAQNPYMYYSKQGFGRLIVMTSPMKSDFTNFQNKAMGATTFLRIAETASFEKPLYMTIGNMSNYPLNESVDEKNPIHLINDEQNVDVIPQIINSASSAYISFSHLDDKISSAGFYNLKDNKGFETILGLNYDRSESYTETFSDENVLEMFEDVGWKNVQLLLQDEKGEIEINSLKAREYWRILIILALVFIAFEILLLKLWKT